MGEHFKLPGDIPVKRTYDKKKRVLHVEPIRSTAPPVRVTQEEWDRIFSDKDEDSDHERDGVQGTDEPEEPASDG